MRNPALMIDKVKFRDNALKLSELFYSKNKKFHAVSKGFCSHEGMVQILADNGVRNLADSRLENFYILRNYADNTLLLRLPMLSEVAEVVALCDMSLNSEWETICALSDAALVQQKIHRIILMLELGDLREGASLEEAWGMIQKIVNLRGVRLAGIGANFKSYGGIIPDPGKMQILNDFAERIEQRYGFELEYVSGGNSANLWLLEENALPEKVNHLRIGEALLLGRETSFRKSVAGLHHDVFTLRAEVIEAKRKSSVPEGRFAKTGRPPQFKEIGMLNRVILALGGIDVEPRGLRPKFKGINYLGHSLDHAIYDVTAFNKQVKVGDTLEFSVDYRNLVRLFVSPYVNKVLV